MGLNSTLCDPIGFMESIHEVRLSTHKDLKDGSAGVIKPRNLRHSDVRMGAQHGHDQRGAGPFRADDENRAMRQCQRHALSCQCEAGRRAGAVRQLT